MDNPSWITELVGESFPVSILEYIGKASHAYEAHCLLGYKGDDMTPIIRRIWVTHEQSRLFALAMGVDKLSKITYTELGFICQIGLHETRWGNRPYIDAIQLQDGTVITEADVPKGTRKLVTTYRDVSQDRLDQYLRFWTEAQNGNSKRYTQRIDYPLNDKQWRQLQRMYKASLQPTGTRFRAWDADKVRYANQFIERCQNGERPKWEWEENNK